MTNNPETNNPEKNKPETSNPTKHKNIRPVIKRVYQRNYQSAQTQQRKPILEELQAIDQAIDQRSKNNPSNHPPLSPSPPPPSSSSKSIQPSLSLGQNNEPPSSSLPLTPNDLSSPINPVSNPQRKLIPEPSNQKNSISEITELTIPQELTRLTDDFQSIPPPPSPDSSVNYSQQSIPIKRPKSVRKLLDSDDDEIQLDSSKQPIPKTKKFKKLKGLSKKDKEEAQRVIAACERQKNTRLAASCRAPLTRIEDIINKATRTIETPTDQSDHLQTNQTSTDPIQDSSDNNDDVLPTADDLMVTSNHQTRTSQSKSQNFHTSLNQEETLKKKEWLHNQRNTALESAPPTTRDELVEMIDSDSDLDILQDSNRSSNIQDHLPTIAADPFEVRLNRIRGNSKSIISQPLPIKKSVVESIPLPFFSTAFQSIKNTNGKKSVKPKDDILMQGLLAKSAIDGALIREQKRSKFIERGGRLAKEVQTASCTSQIQRVDLKSILNSNQHPNTEQEEEEEDIECDWDEVASSTHEIELSGEEEVEQAEGNEDEIQDSQTEDDDDEQDDPEELDTINDTTIRPVEGPSILKTVKLSRPLQTNTRILSSESLRNSIVPSILPAHQLDHESKILAPDSNSTDQDSSRTSSKPPLSDSSEQPFAPLTFKSRSSSPVDFPGFNLDQTSKSIIQDFPSDDHSSNSSDSSSNSLPGFQPVKESQIEGLSASMIDGFSQIEEFSMKSKVHNNMIDNNKQNHTSGFSQFFKEEDEEGGEFNFTHPPPLLKSKIQIRQDGDQQGDLDDEISATCILPAVDVLPEERERDLVMMILGAQKNSMDDDDQPIEYVNHRGFLTQHKPTNEPNGPPDSPLMSQDPISRTPFALRKGKSRVVESDSVRQIEKEANGSPTKIRNHVRRESIDCESNSFTLPMAGLVKFRAENAFTKVMNAQKSRHSTPPSLPSLPSGMGKMFLADEADESEDEYEGLGRRLSGDEEEGLGSETEEAKKMMEELVDDAEDERDEKIKLEEDLALKNLARHHLDQLDQKFSDQIHKIVNGKFRIQKAKGNRVGTGAISDSDSEDDLEVETFKANKRAQEYDAKKKKKAIDLLASKHQSFFKSYQEGTSQWVDDDELAYLQPPEEAENKSKEDDELDSEDEIEKEEYDQGEDQEELLEDIREMGSKPKHDKENEKNKLSSTISSSPPINSEAHSLPFKINHHFSLLSSARNPFKNSINSNLHQQKQQASKSHTNPHHDLDKIYEGLKSTKDSLTERQKRLVIEELGTGEGRSHIEGDKTRGGGIEERRKNSGNHNNMNNNKSSSITYQQQQQRKLDSIKAKIPINTSHSNLNLNSTTTATVLPPACKSLNRLAKLKNKK